MTRLGLALTGAGLGIELWEG